MIQKLSRKINALLSKSRTEIFWILPAWLVLGIARGAVVFVSFERIVRALGLAYRAFPATPLVTLHQRETARKLALSILCAVKYSPWLANCLPQALCATCLLRFYRIPHSVFLGILRDQADGSVQAHAWVCAGDITVTGGGDLRPFAIVGCFD
jgi:hypothetical protein